MIETLRSGTKPGAPVSLLQFSQVGHSSHSNIAVFRDATACAYRIWRKLRGRLAETQKTLVTSREPP